MLAQEFSFSWYYFFPYQDIKRVTRRTTTKLMVPVTILTTIPMVAVVIGSGDVITPGNASLSHRSVTVAMTVPTVKTNTTAMVKICFLKPFKRNDDND